MFFVFFVVQSDSSTAVRAARSWWGTLQRTTLAACYPFDFGADDAVDVLDLAEFQNTFHAPGLLPLTCHISPLACCLPLSPLLYCHPAVTVPPGKSA